MLTPRDPEWAFVQAVILRTDDPEITVILVSSTKSLQIKFLAKA